MADHSRKPVIAIVGSAPNALGDLLGFLSQTAAEADVLAVGMDAVRILKGRCRYIATNHREDIAPIQDLMAARLDMDWLLIAPRPWPRVDIVEPYDPPTGRSGSSAMTAVLAALRMGYRRAVLCGCPLTGNAPEGNPYEAFRLGWLDRQEELGDRVRSMSGWTMELLGFPDRRWLDG